MKKLLLLLVLTPLFAAGPDGFMMWKADELKGYEKKLAAKVNAQKAANEQLAKFPSYMLAMVHREADAAVETHLNNSELFVIVSGEATEIVGGTAVDNKLASPGEMRASALKGGYTVQLRPGDVMRMPANVPHQMQVAAGKQITFIVVKEPVN